MSPASILAAQATAGNRAVGRMLAVQRHPGAESKKDAHKAEAHATAADQREHRADARRAEQATQDAADDLTSDTLELELKKKATDGGKVLLISSSALPPKLQAYIRQVQAPITDLESGLAAAAGIRDAAKKKDQLAAVTKGARERIRTSARSWHDDDQSKIPLPKGGSSPRADFFFAWRAEDVLGGKATPTKQQKKGGPKQDRPYREYTAVGWSEGATKGRLIYDPIDDVFYLSLKHYQDEKYFKVDAPRAAVGAGVDAGSPFDLDFLLYEAYAQAARDLEDMVKRQKAGAAEARQHEAADPKSPEAKRGAELDRLHEGMTEDAKTYITELFALREQYLETFEAAREAKRKPPKPAAVPQPKKGGKKAKAPAPAPAQTPEDKEPNASFRWWGQEWIVGSTAGYIGYRNPKGGITYPSYTTGMTIGDLAKRFRESVVAKTVPQPELNTTCLLLASVVAEPSRHPTAVVEALLSIVQNSPIAGGTKAFGTALPMAAGGTIATGGVAQEVQLSEARIGRNVVLGLLAKHLGASPAAAEELLFDLAGKMPDKFVDTVKPWLLAALTSQEQQEKTFKPAKASYERRQKAEAEQAAKSQAPVEQAKPEAVEPPAKLDAPAEKGPAPPLPVEVSPELVKA